MNRATPLTSIELRTLSDIGAMECLEHHEISKNRRREGVMSTSEERDALHACWHKLHDQVLANCSDQYKAAFKCVDSATRDFTICKNQREALQKCFYVNCILKEEKDNLSPSAATIGGV